MSKPKLKTMSKKADGDMSVVEAAAYLGVSKQYLYQLRHKGLGPACTRKAVYGLGKGPTERVFYQKRDLDAWDKERREAKAQPRKQTKKAKPSKPKKQNAGRKRKNARRSQQTMKKAA